MLLTACSTKKNTAGSRFWQAFTTRYNVYFNGHEAYLEGLREQESGHKDDYTALLPVFPVSNEATRSLGKGNFATAITKSEKAIQLHSIKKKPEVDGDKRRTPKMKQYLARQEYNPFLKNAWLMMGQAQFQQGSFIEAASTFSYIARHYAAEPLVASEARAWLARCYAQMEWYYDAEDALNKMSRDSMTTRLRRLRNASEADLLLHQKRYAEALPALQLAAREAKGKTQRARLYFLLGQVQKALGNDEAAYKAFGKTLGRAPAFELAFNARIQQTEVLSRGRQSRQMIGKLRRMAANENNRAYLDQVYYAMGNIYLAQGDTLSAIGAYEKGREKSQRNGVEKGVLLLRLGELYWNRRHFSAARDCYAEAIGKLDKTREGYDLATRRSQVLDKLVPYTTAVALQDSLQLLAAMDEKSRNAAIDRVIALERKKLEEARRASRDSAALARQEANDAQGVAGATKQPAGATKQDAATWYFYNPLLVQQGKQTFRQQWGTRRNADDWRRSNRTILAGRDEADEALPDTAAAAGKTPADENGTPSDDPASNPLERAYYLAQIPFSDEARAASDRIIMDGLHHAGVIEKDELDDLPLAAATLGRVARQYPHYEQIEDVYHQLFLLYLRWNRPHEAEQYRRLLADNFPQSTVTRTITNPNYERNARFGRLLEDSLYTATYDAFRRGDRATVARNAQTSAEEFPDGVNRAKFLFLNALSRLGHDDPKTLAKELRELVNKYPDSDVSQMAGMIVKGLEAGRKPGTNGYDLGSLWSRRTADAAAAGDSLQAERRLSPERRTPFLFLVVAPADSLDSHQLLYDLARFNFKSFTLRHFDIAQDLDSGLVRFRVNGFQSFGEAHTYAQRIYKDEALVKQLRRARTFLISERNLRLIGTEYSYADYAKFYDKTFAPMKINPSLPLDEQPALQKYEEETYPIELGPIKHPLDSVKPQVPLETTPDLPEETAPEGTEDYPADPATTPAAPVKQEQTPAKTTPQSPASPPKKQEQQPAKEKTETPKQPADPKKQESDPKKQESEPKKQEEKKSEEDVPQQQKDSEETEDDGEWYPE